MVSKASEDLPEPESPVITVKRSRGISTLMSLRLCWRAPRTVMRSIAMMIKSQAALPIEESRSQRRNSDSKRLAVTQQASSTDGQIKPEKSDIIHHKGRS